MPSINPMVRFFKFLRGGFAPDLTLLENWLFRLAVIIPIGAAAYLVTSYDLLTLVKEQTGIYEQLVYLWQHEKLTALIACVNR
ncbi:hypothetical protein [Marinobacter sp. MIT932201]|uniref:hypothetical protein n=1 Tax=Marinobacter sp. MIT932201 TaxID=3096995 RepID=UPI003999B49F